MFLGRKNQYCENNYTTKLSLQSDYVDHNKLENSERDQPWDFFGRNDAEAETPVLWPPHVKG